MHLTAWVGNKFPGCNNGSLLGNQSILLIPQIKTEYTIIFSMNAGKAFNYIQQTFLIKKKKKLKIGIENLDIMKTVSQKPRANFA